MLKNRRQMLRSVIGILAGVNFLGVEAKAQAFIGGMLFRRQLQVRTVTLSSGSSWTVPSGVSKLDKVECWGAGGGTAVDSWSYGGGGGGAYASIVNLTVTPGAAISYSIGAGGLTRFNQDGLPGGDTWFMSTSTVMAKGGTNSSKGSFNGGVGGSAASSVGTIKNSGGNGGNAPCCGTGGGGGGGAGSATGPGGTGSSTGGGNNGANGGASPGGASGGIGGVGANGTVGGSAANGGGGGGGGASSKNSGSGGAPGGGSGAPGGNGPATTKGGDGQIIITYYE